MEAVKGILILVKAHLQINTKKGTISKEDHMRSQHRI